MFALNQIKQYFTNINKAWIGVGMLIIGVGSCGYFLQKSKTNKNNDQKHSNNFNQIQQSKITQTHQEQENQYAFHRYYFDKNLQIRKVMDSIQGNVNVQQIFLNSPAIIVDQYRKFTKQIRNRRRLIRTVNENQYIEIILQYENQVEQLLQRSRQQLLDQCQIDLEEFQRMKDAFQCSQNLQDLIRKSKKILKQSSLQSIRQIPAQKLTRIIQTQLNFIKTKLYQRLKQKLILQYNLCQDQILKVIKTLIDDILYQKFGYQREEIQYTINKSMTQINELKKQRQFLQNEVGNISIQSQNQSQNSRRKQSYKKSVGKTQSNVDSSIEQPFQLNLDQ